jgi:hypothetical protein
MYVSIISVLSVPSSEFVVSVNINDLGWKYSHLCVPVSLGLPPFIHFYLCIIPIKAAVLNVITLQLKSNSPSANPSIKK